MSADKANNLEMYFGKRSNRYHPLNADGLDIPRRRKNQEWHARMIGSDVIYADPRADMVDNNMKVFSHRRMST